jgi:hypothetical protein
MLKTAFITPLSAVDTTDKEGVGTLRWEGNKCYKYVKYIDGTANLDLAAGDVVVYTDASSTQVTADVSDIAASEIGAGVALGAVTEDARFIWIQIKGAATLSTTIGGTPADGDPLTAKGAADKALTKAAEADSAAVYVPVVAFAVDASEKTALCDFPF